jgi:hypothetical protein
LITRVDGCTKRCCTTARLVDIPRKPADLSWLAYAPHFNGRQITRLNTRWAARPAA